jgi:hypothetical protein
MKETINSPTVTEEQNTSHYGSKMYKGIILFKKKGTEVPHKWQAFVLKFSTSMTSTHNNSKMEITCKI